jgi:hypothetical protein
MKGSMVATEPALRTVQAVRARSGQTAPVDDLARRYARLISRLVLALLLAAVSVLIPGEATRFLEAPLDWSDLAPKHRTSLTRMRCSATSRRQPSPTQSATSVV